MKSRIFAMGACLALGTGLAACGSDDEETDAPSSGSGAGTVNLYSSLPLQGASKDQTNAMVQGIRLALDQTKNKAGDTTIKYTSLDDSTAQAGNWDEQQVQQNARKVAQDKKAIGYIGEFNSGATALSLPILNRAGMPQVSPANTYDGLTVAVEGATEPGEPEKYYPTRERTYLRIVPRDKIQGAALATQMKKDGCTKIAVANDKDTYGAGLSRLFAQGAETAGVEVASNEGIDPQASNYRSYASGLKGDGVDCFLFAGVTANGAVQIYKDVASAIPGVKTYGGDGVCESGFTNPNKKGIPKTVGANFKCTVATLDLQSYPGGRDFLTAFQKKFGAGDPPDPYAIYGFEAADLFIDTLKELGADAGDKAKVLKALMATKDRKSALGTYSFDENGDTTLADYGIYKVGSDGNPEFDSKVEAAT